MAERRKLQFATEMDALADIAHLRAGWTKTNGQWTLAQIAYHLRVPLERSLVAPATMELTAEQKQWAPLVDQWINGGYPEKLETPPAMMPPADVAESAGGDYINALRQLLLYPHSHATSAFFGPVPIDKFRRIQLIHAEHHLGFLSPTRPPRRKDVKFADEDAVIAEIEKLRHGYTQAGTWSLQQICWHLDTTTAFRMIPEPVKPNTPQQDAMKPMLENLLKSGRLPPGIKAPDVFIPPADLHDDEIDRCIATLKTWKVYNGPVAQHRIFGNLTLDQARILNRAHCAHHLSCLLPLGK